MPRRKTRPDFVTAQAIIRYPRAGEILVKLKIPKEYMINSSKDDILSVIENRILDAMRIKVTNLSAIHKKLKS
jgi:hypothetical protein